MSSAAQPLPPVVDVDEVELDHLSPRLRELADLIGLKATMQLVHAFGGRRLYVPIKPLPEHHLAQLIGLDALTRLSRVFGTEDRILIPRADNALRQARNRRIRAQYGPKSIRQLAHEYQLTERQIYEIVADPVSQNRTVPADPAREKQRPLFD